jgi:hypothetical protein
VRTGPFPFDDEWNSLVASLQTALRLYKHRDGTPTRNAKYLHQRTGRTISSLSHLIRVAAISAILSGDDAITRLDNAIIDHGAESTTSHPDSRADRGRQHSRHAGRCGMTAALADQLDIGDFVRFDGTLEGRDRLILRACRDVPGA